MTEPGDFESSAARGRGGLAAEFLGFLRDNKKWWLLPIVLAVLGVSLLVLFSSTAAAPFIYTIF